VLRILVIATSRPLGMEQAHSVERVDQTGRALIAPLVEDHLSKKEPRGHLRGAVIKSKAPNHQCREDNEWYSGIPADGWYWYYGLDSRWHLCLQIILEGGQ